MHSMSIYRPLVAGVFMAMSLIVVPLVGVAADMFTGTWKINLEKSTYSPGPPPKGPNIAEFKSVDNGIHIVLLGVNAAGRKTRLEYTVYFDGKQYPITSSSLDGQPTPTTGTTTSSAKKIDDYTFETTQTTNGKVGGTTRVVVAKDGKSHIATQTATNAQGQPVKNVLFLEKQ
jgi:hypothetical protein